MAKRSTKSARAKKGSKKKEPVEVEPEEDYDPYADYFDGPLTKRRFGLRVDDEVVVYIVGGDMLRVVCGRVLEHKKGLHLVDEDGHYHRISYDWVTDIIVLRHNRPVPNEDPEYKRKAPTPKAKASAQAQGPPTDQAYQ